MSSQGLRSLTARAAARRTLTAIAAVAVVAAVTIAGLAAWELWGTSAVTAREQDDLAAEFEAQLEASDNTVVETLPPPTTEASTVPPTTNAPVIEELAAEPLVEADELLSDESEGSSDGAIARLDIPELGEEWYVVSGVGDDDLLRGPGHYTSTPGPGEPGNFAIAGHRSGYGAPFENVDQLEIGDEIHITTPDGERFTYAVSWIEIVEPDENWVIKTTDTSKRELTLTTCHPKNSIKQRLIVRAEIVEA